MRGAAQAVLCVLGLAAVAAADWWRGLRRMFAAADRELPPRRRESNVGYVLAPVASILVVAFGVPVPPALVGLWVGLGLQLGALVWWEARLRRVERAWAGTPFWSGPLPGDPAIDRVVGSAPPALWPATVSRRPEIDWTDLPPALEFGSWAVLVTAASTLLLLARDTASAGALLTAGGLGVVVAVAGWRMAAEQQRILGHRRTVWGFKANSVLLRRPSYAAARLVGSVAAAIAVLHAGGGLEVMPVITVAAGVTFGIGIGVVVGRSDAADAVPQRDPRAAPRS